MELIVTRITADAVLPDQQPDSIGYDVYAYGDHIISPNETKIIPLGFHAMLPKGYGAFVWDRSSFGAMGMHVFHQLISDTPKIEHESNLVPFGGVIDWSYKGQWGVILHSFLKEPFRIRHGSRICQFVVHKIDELKIKEVTMAEFQKIPSLRGEKGLGSSEGKDSKVTQASITSAKTGGTKDQ